MPKASNAKRKTGAEDWPANTVEKWPLDKIKPYEKNPRHHPEAQVALLASLMKKHGVDQPIVVDEAGVILKGHGRRLAAIEAGFADFPVIQRKGLSEADKRAIRIQDNQLALLSRWDDELIRLEVNDLKLEGYDVTLLGFEEGQLVAFTLDPELGANDPEAAWAGMPGFEMGDKRAFRSVIVHFHDEKAVELFEKKLGLTMSEKARYLWYPELIREPARDKRYIAKAK